MEIKKFWYESNQCWGYVETFSELTEKAKLQLKANNSIQNIDDFLIKSRYSIQNNSFGTRSEHKAEFNLKDYLIKHNKLDEFLDYFEDNK